MNIFETLIGLDMMKAAANLMAESQGDEKLMLEAADKLRFAWANLGCGLFDVSPETMARAVNTLEGQWHPATKHPDSQRAVCVLFTGYGEFEWPDGSAYTTAHLIDGEWWLTDSALRNGKFKVVAWCEIPAFDLKQDADEEGSDHE